jgi:C-terminal processing protease CtpA/Prc
VVSGAGVGGRVYSLLARAHSLTLGAVKVDKPVAYLSRQEKGAFADDYIAGNVGYGVLHRFNITFDYSHQQLYFEKNSAYNAPDIADRSGMWLERTDRGFEVFDVVAGGPAERAGVKAGDIIVAVDGRPIARWTLADARARLKGRVGTRVRVKIEGGKPRELDIALRDLV